MWDLVISVWRVYDFISIYIVNIHFTWWYWLNRYIYMIISECHYNISSFMIDLSYIYVVYRLLSGFMLYRSAYWLSDGTMTSIYSGPLTITRCSIYSLNVIWTNVCYSLVLRSYRISVACFMYNSAFRIVPFLLPAHTFLIFTWFIFKKRFSETKLKRVWSIKVMQMWLKRVG